MQPSTSTLPPQMRWPRMNHHHDIALASVKLAPPAAVSAGATVGWLDYLTTYGQAAVIIATLIYTILQIVFLLRDKLRKNAPKD